MWALRARFHWKTTTPFPNTPHPLGAGNNILQRGREVDWTLSSAFSFRLSLPAEIRAARGESEQLFETGSHLGTTLPDRTSTTTILPDSGLPIDRRREISTGRHDIRDVGSFRKVMAFLRGCICRDILSIRVYDPVKQTAAIIPPGMATRRSV